MARKLSGTLLASLGSLGSLLLVACAASGPAQAPTGPKVLPSAERDYDRDGFPDPRDRCPRERGEAPFGCADKDHDGDGLKSSVDRCPNFAGPPPDGCPPPDADNDGVANDDDRCQGNFENKNGFEDGDGCADEIPKDLAKFTGVIKGITFDVDRDTLKPGGKSVLDRAADVLKRYPGVRIEISAHIDDVLRPPELRDLTARRANTVKSYLVEHGVDAARLETRDAGFSEPLDNNKTSVGRARNRRIEFTILVK